MKKALKIISITVGVLVLVLVIAFLLFIKSLPSTWEIKQAISPKKAQNPEFVQNAKPSALNAAATPLPEKPGTTPAPSHEEKVDDSKALSMQVVKEDFMNEQKPLSTVCAYLPAAEQSKFLRKDDSGSANEFMKVLADHDHKDPLAESAAPLMRYLFRIDGMRDLIEMIDKADAEHDQSLFKKAEFYTKLALAGQAMRANKANLDRILMKSYNLYILSRAVGKHPELARDPATLNFCDQMEKNLNMGLDYNPEEQSAELQKFLDYAKISPQEVDYDPNYRSDVKFDITNRSATLNHVWIEKLFEKDIAKARKEIKAPTPSSDAQ